MKIAEKWQQFEATLRRRRSVQLVLAKPSSFWRIMSFIIDDPDSLCPACGERLNWSNSGELVVIGMHPWTKRICFAAARHEKCQSVKSADLDSEHVVWFGGSLEEVDEIRQSTGPLPRQLH
jgi:hypothetical protein